MSPNLILPELNRFTIYNNNIIAMIASPGVLSENKITFDKNYNIEIPKTIEICLEDICEKRTVTHYRDFNNNTYIQFKKLSFKTNNNLILPLYEKTEFLCLSCKKIYKQNSDRCCSLSGGILIYKTKLNKIYIPKLHDNQKSISDIKNEFTSLHFSDILDTILLK